MTKQIIFLLCSFLYLSSCTGPAKAPAGNNKELAGLFEKYYEERLTLFPMEATSNGDNRYNDKLYADFTDSYRAKTRAFYEKYNNEISRFNREQLNDKEKINYDCFVYNLKNSLDGYAFHSNYMPLEQIGGFHLTFAQLGSGSYIQPFNTVKDYENWLQRVQSFGPYTDSVIAYFRKGMAAGYVLPKTLVVKMIPQMQGMITTDVKQSIFY